MTRQLFWRAETRILWTIIFSSRWIFRFLSFEGFLKFLMLHDWWCQLIILRRMIVMIWNLGRFLMTAVDWVWIIDRLWKGRIFLGNTFILHVLLAPHYAVIFFQLNLLRWDGFLMLIAAQRLQTQALIAFASLVRSVGHLRGKLLRHNSGRMLTSSDVVVLIITDGHWWGNVVFSWVKNDYHAALFLFLLFHGSFHPACWLVFFSRLLVKLGHMECLLRSSAADKLFLDRAFLTKMLMNLQ